MHYHYFTIEQRESLERLLRAQLGTPLGTQQGAAQALQRLHSPDYGVCAQCGADIPYVRLLDFPGELLCAACRASKP